MIRELVVIGAVVLSVCPEAALAQDSEIAKALACFETSILENKPSCHDSRSVGYVLRTGSEDEVEQLLPELEALALSAESKRVRISATITIGLAGRRDTLGPPRVLPILVRLYHTPPETGIRHSALGQAAEQPDQVAAAAFLRTVAEERDFAGGLVEWTRQLNAVELLSRMGSAGVAELSELAARNSVTEPLARNQLEWMRQRLWASPYGPARDLPPLQP